MASAERFKLLLKKYKGYLKSGKYGKQGSLLEKHYIKSGVRETNGFAPKAKFSMELPTSEALERAGLSHRYEREEVMVAICRRINRLKKQGISDEIIDAEISKIYSGYEELVEKVKSEYYRK